MLLPWRSHRLRHDLRQYDLLAVLSDHAATAADLLWWLLLDVDHAAGTMGPDRRRLYDNRPDELSLHLPLSDLSRQFLRSGYIDVVYVAMRHNAEPLPESLSAMHHDHHDAQPLRDGLLLAMDRLGVESCDIRLSRQLQLLRAGL